MLTDFTKAVSPGFLIGDGDSTKTGVNALGFGERYMGAIAFVADTLIAGAEAAIKMRFPGVGDPSSLPRLGNDRQIVRGIAETDAQYGARLARPFSAWRFAGMVRGVMSSVVSWLTGASPKVWSVLQGPSTGPNSWDVYAPGANPSTAPTHTQVTPRNWNWDGLDRPKRRWLVIDAAGWFTSTRKCGDGSMCGAATCGSDMPTSYGSALRQLVDTWRSADTNWLWVIVAIDATLFPSGGAVGDPKLPDGLFGDWSKIVAGVLVPSRFAQARYMSGSPGV